MQACGLPLEIFIASSSSGLYCTMRPGSSPQLAEKISFGLASSIRVASSFAAKPPNTTECTAPIRAQASIAITASGPLGLIQHALVALTDPKSATQAGRGFHP